MKYTLEKLLIGGLYALLLTPLLFQQSLMHPLITPKAIFFYAVVEILLAIYLYLALFYKEYRLSWSWLTISLLLFAAVLLISTWLAANPYRSFWSIPARQTGVFLWLHLVAFFFMLKSLGKKIGWRAYFGFSLAVAVAVGLFAFVQEIFPNFFFDRPAEELRLSGTIGNPIFFASYMMFHIFLGAWLSSGFYRDKKRWLTILCSLASIFSLVSLVLTQTRGAFLGLLVGLFVLIAYAVFGKRSSSLRSLRYLAIGLFSFIVIFGIVFWLTIDQPFWQQVPALKRFINLESGGPRLNAWKMGLQGFVERPALGWGWENYIFVVNKHYNPKALRYGITETFFDKPHNNLLEILVATGLLGFLFYALIFFFALRRSNAWFWALLTAYLAQSFFAFDTLVTYIMLFAVLAYLDREDKKLEHNANETSRWSPVVLVAILALVLAPVYFVVRPLYQANNYQYHAINSLINYDIETGLRYYELALAVPSVHIDYVRADLGPLIPQLYRQGIAIPNLKKYVERSLQELKTAADNEPIDYNRQLQLADLVNRIYEFNPEYFKEAELALKRAEELSPGRQGTYYVLSKIRFLQGDVEGALAAIQKAIELDPEVGDPHFYRALLLLEAGRKEEGLKELNLAISLQRFANSLEEARVLANLFRRLQLENIDLREQLKTKDLFYGAILYELGRTEDAFAEVGDVESPDNYDSAELLGFLGGLIGDKGDYGKAAKFFEKALDLLPNDLETRMKLGLAYYFSDQKDKAKELIIQVMNKTDLKISPQYEQIKPILTDLGLE